VPILLLDLKHTTIEYFCGFRGDYCFLYVEKVIVFFLLFLLLLGPLEQSPPSIREQVVLRIHAEGLHRPIDVQGRIQGLESSIGKAVNLFECQLRALLTHTLDSQHKLVHDAGLQLLPVLLRGSRMWILGIMLLPFIRVELARIANL
jgi:hypothetical protein